MRSTSVSMISSSTSLSSRPTSSPLYSPRLGHRPHPDLELEGQRLPLRLRGGDDVDLRIADRRHRRVEQRFFVPLRQRVPDRFREHRGEPHPLDHQVRRRLALAEAGQPQFAGHRAGGSVGGALDVLGLDFGLDLDA
ncbi:MAG: hypothetical protein QM729_14320 [Solirubrobacterales bacterium]